MSNKPRVYSASDYAGLSANGASFYYGYEQTACVECLGHNCKDHPDAEQEWCFVATLPNLTVTIASSRLGSKDKFNCDENLLLGIGWLFAKYKFVPL